MSASRPSNVPQTDDLLCFLVHSTGAAFNRAYRKPLGRLGLTYPQYLVMLSLWAEDGLSETQIGERLRLEAEALSPLLAELERVGHVARVAAPEGEGGVLVRLTGAGHVLRDEVGRVVGCVRNAVGMDDGDLDDLMARMRSLRDNLEAAASILHRQGRVAQDGGADLEGSRPR